MRIGLLIIIFFLVMELQLPAESYREWRRLT